MPERRQLTRQSDDIAVSIVRILSLVTISVIIIAYAAARETTAVIVADASRVVLTRGVGVLGFVLQVGKFGHENVVIDKRNVWIGLIICAVFRAQFANTIKSGRAAPFFSKVFLPARTPRR